MDCSVPLTAFLPHSLVSQRVRSSPRTRIRLTATDNTQPTPAATFTLAMRLTSSQRGLRSYHYPATHIPETYCTKRHGEHGLHAGVLQRAQQPLSAEESPSCQGPEFHVLHSHRDKLRVRIRPELSHENALIVSRSAGNPGT